MSEQLKRIAYQVHGRVQGVFFRNHARDSASKHNITGWVRNHAGGHVEGEAQGKSDDLDNFLKELESGSSESKVEKVMQKEAEGVKEEETGFEKVERYQNANYHESVFDK